MPVPLPGVQDNNAICSECGCCISRKDFVGWFCETEGCNYACELLQLLLPMRSIEFPHGSQYHGHSIPPCSLTQKEHHQMDNGTAAPKSGWSPECEGPIFMQLGCWAGTTFGGWWIFHLS